jgi:hypothetical protein
MSAPAADRWWLGAVGLLLLAHRLAGSEDERTVYDTSLRLNSYSQGGYQGY